MPDFRSGKPRWYLGAQPLTVCPAGVDTQLTYGAVGFADPISIVTGSTITVSRPGLYFIHATARRLAVAVTGENQLKVKVNGVTREFEKIGPTTIAWWMQVNTLTELFAGDVVSVAVGGHPTLATTIEGGTSFFRGTRVGPQRWT